MTLKNRRIASTHRPPHAYFHCCHPKRPGGHCWECFSSWTLRGLLWMLQRKWEGAGRAVLQLPRPGARSQSDSPALDWESECRRTRPDYSSVKIEI